MASDLLDNRASQRDRRGCVVQGDHGGLRPSPWLALSSCALTNRGKTRLCKRSLAGEFSSRVAKWSPCKVS